MNEKIEKSPSWVGWDDWPFSLPQPGTGRGKDLRPSTENSRVEKILAELPMSWHSGLESREGPNIRPVSHVGHLVCASAAQEVGHLRLEKLNETSSTLRVKLSLWLCGYSAWLLMKAIRKKWGVFSSPHLSGAWTPSRKAGAIWLHPSLTSPSPGLMLQLTKVGRIEATGVCWFSSLSLVKNVWKY